MGSMPRGVLQQMASGGRQRQNDRWEPSETKDSAVRVYRFEKVIEVGGVQTTEKSLIAIRMLHFNGKGVAPDECSGGAACEKCRKKSLLEASGVPDALEKAEQMAPTYCPTFVVIPLDEPTRFRTFDARFTAFQGVMVEIAKAGGYRSAKYPEPKAWDDGGEIGALFDRCVEDGCGLVCGPSGQDLILSPTKKGKGISWSVSRMQDGNKPLPFPEDASVLNPETVQARIKAAMAKKNEKEGDA